MSRPSDILLLLKLCTHNTKQLAQVFAQTITMGLTNTTLTWNCIIRAYAKSPMPIKAILIYNHFIKLSSLPPDNHTYPALLKACTHLLSLLKGKEIHAHVTKIGLDSDVYVQNSLVYLYGVTSKMDDARRMFREMAQRDVVSWNSILVAACTTDSSSGCDALVLFKQMLSNEIGADEITVVAVLSACTKVGGVDYGRMIHVFVLKKGFRCCLNLDNALLGLYAKVGDMNASFRLFSEMGRRDIVSYTILINGHVELGLIDLAREIFDRMDEKDLVSWNSMISGYVKVKRPKEAINLFEKMEIERVKPDETTIVSVLSACASLSNLQLGKLVHGIIHRTNIRVDVFVGTCLIDMYAKCGSLKEAVHAFYGMKHKDVFAWTAVIAGLANYGHGKEALSLFSQMQREGWEPNDATFVTLLTACSRSGLIEEGRHWFDQMVEVYKIQPKMEHLGCIVDILSRGGLLCQAEAWIRTIPAEDKIIVYRTLLSACVSYGDMGLGEKLAKELIELHPKSHGVYVLLSNFYASSGRWDEVAEMRRIMKQLDMKKEAGISFIEACR